MSPLNARGISGIVPAFSKQERHLSRRPSAIQRLMFHIPRMTIDAGLRGSRKIHVGFVKVNPGGRSVWG